MFAFFLCSSYVVLYIVQRTMIAMLGSCNRQYHPRSIDDIHMYETYETSTVCTFIPKVGSDDTVHTVLYCTVLYIYTHPARPGPLHLNNQLPVAYSTHPRPRLASFVRAAEVTTVQSSSALLWRDVVGDGSR